MCRYVKLGLTISCKIFLSILLIFCNTATTLAEQYFHLTAPDSHFVLKGNLSCTLRRTKSAQPLYNSTIVVRVSIFSNNATLDNAFCDQDLNFPPESTSIDFQVPCWCFDRAGVYDLKIDSGQSTWNRSKIILAQAKVIVRWPEIVLQLPPNRTSATGSEVPLKISISQIDNRLMCSPIDVKNGTKIDSTFLSIRRSIDRENDSRSIWKEIDLSPTTNWWTMINSIVQLPCHLFAETGTYEVNLITKIDTDQSIVIAKSNQMVIWKSISSLDDYDLKVIAHYVYPCPPDKGLPISYRRSDSTSIGCRRRGSSYEAVRLFAAQPRKNDRSEKRGKSLKTEELFLTLKHNYVAEEKLPLKEKEEEKRNSNAGVAYFGCNHFDLIYPEYCFQLVSVYDDGTVLERAKHCVPTQSSKYSSIHGQWSSWQSWGSCTVTCGADGVQHRLRYCNKPEPTDGGRFCSGDGLETRSCSMEACPVSPQQINQSIPAQLKSIDDDRCACGCNLSRPEGGIVIVDSFGCVDNVNVTFWRIVAWFKYQSIELKIVKLRFRNPDIEWIKIRDDCDDSDPKSGTLLFDSSLDTFFDDRSPAIIRSRSDRVSIEYYFANRYDHKSISEDLNNNNNVLQKLDSTQNWYGVLIKYKFLSSIDRSEIDNIDNRWAWWIKIKSDRTWFLLFAISIGVAIVFCLLLIYFLAAKYTLKKLRSKCNYLMLLSQTTAASTSTNHQLLATPILGRSSVCEIVGRSENRSDSSTTEPLLSKSRDIDDQQQKSISKSKSIPKHQNKNLAQIPEEIMQTSNYTESTRLSGTTQNSVSPNSPQQLIDNSNSISKSTPKSMRSIGIQLSSPALSGMRRHVSADKCQHGSSNNDRSDRSIDNSNHKIPISISSANSQIARPESPNFSFNGTEQDDFEYDYYDAPVPGSFFNYQHTQLLSEANNWRSSFFETDIDIDDIIDQSDLMQPLNNNGSVGGNHSSTNSNNSPPTAMVSVSTQSHAVQVTPIAAGDSAESSEWSFKWTKPGTTTTQFHFL